MLEIVDLKYKYQEDRYALKGINLDLREGRVIGIIGDNGSGKSTLFLNILGLLRPSSGEIRYKGQPLKYNKKFLRDYRKEVNGIFQDPEKQIFFSSVYDDIAFPLRNLGLAEDEIERRIREVLTRMDSLELIERPVHFLSYGQKKRVNIAGALVLDSKILLLDEPTAGLDNKTVLEIKNILQKEREHRQLIISSHDLDFIDQVCDKVYKLEDGLLVK